MCAQPNLYFHMKHYRYMIACLNSVWNFRIIIMVQQYSVVFEIFYVLFIIIFLHLLGHHLHLNNNLKKHILTKFRGTVLKIV